MTTKEKLFEKKTLIKEIAMKHGAYDIRVFGSVSRGDDREDSDIDLLVKTKEYTSPWFPGGLIADLEDILGQKVEVVTEAGLSRLIRDQVLGEATPL
jgi:predicted nucleotidyltransferase